VTRTQRKSSVTLFYKNAGRRSSVALFHENQKTAKLCRFASYGTNLYHLKSTQSKALP